MKYVLLIHQGDTPTPNHPEDWARLSQEERPIGGAWRGWVRHDEILMTSRMRFEILCQSVARSIGILPQMRPVPFFGEAVDFAASRLSHG